MASEIRRLDYRWDIYFSNICPIYGLLEIFKEAFLLFGGFICNNFALKLMYFKFSMNLSRYSIPFLLLILVLAFGLRTYNLDKHGIFFDEKATVLVSQGMAMEGNTQKNCFYTQGKTTFTPKEFWADKSVEDYYDAIRRSDIGNSPFYYVMLHNWINLFGISDYSIRFLSVLFSCLTIILLFFFIIEHFKNLQLTLLACFLIRLRCLRK
jgi:uncharacterized membrane protein